MQNVESFYNELTPVLAKIKDSPDAILEGTEVSKVTLWRWTNGINRKYPDPHKLLSLLSKISGKKKPNEVATYFGGEISNYFSKVIPHLFAEKMDVNITENQNEIFKDFHSFLVFILCETEAGSTKEEIINTVGNLGLKKLGLNEEAVSSELLIAFSGLVEKKISELESSGVIELRPDGKYHTKVKDIIFNSETVINFYPELISRYSRPNESNLGFTTLLGYQQSISAELAKEIKTETKDFFLKIYQKMKDNKCRDGIPFQIINFTDRLIFEKTELNLTGVQ